MKGRKWKGKGEERRLDTRTKEKSGKKRTENYSDEMFEAERVREKKIAEGKEGKKRDK